MEEQSGSRRVAYQTVTFVTLARRRDHGEASCCGKTAGRGVVSLGKLLLMSMRAFEGTAVLQWYTQDTVMR